jgi:hypothetical protein
MIKLIMFFYKHTHTHTRTMQTTKYIRPPYFKTLHSRYYRLPKVLWDLIWTYDDRYRIDFKQSVNELNRYFNHNRIMDRILGEVPLYSIYLTTSKTKWSIYRRTVDSFAQYLLSKRKIFGDGVLIDNLKYVRLRKIPV